MSILTDIEGSTALLERLGEQAYAEELATHRRVIRAVFSEQGGVEEDTQGDAFFYVFAEPAAAVSAAAKVLVSAATQRLLTGFGLSLQGLGEHRVKDFVDPIGLFQVGPQSSSARVTAVENL